MQDTWDFVANNIVEYQKIRKILRNCAKLVKYEFHRFFQDKFECKSGYNNFLRVMDQSLIERHEVRHPFLRLNCVGFQIDDFSSSLIGWRNQFFNQSEFSTLKLKIIQAGNEHFPITEVRCASCGAYMGDEISDYRICDLGNHHAAWSVKS